MGPVVFQPYQGDTLLGRRQGSLQVGERLLETTPINDTFTSLVLPEAGTDFGPFPWEGVGNPHTAEDPAGPCSKQVYITTLALGLLSTFQAQHPYQLPLLGMDTSTEYAEQAGQSFPLLLKDGNATPQPTRTLGKITGTSEKHRSSGWETPKNAQIHHHFSPDTAPVFLPAYELAASPRELQGHHSMAEHFLHPGGCRA